MNNPQIPPEILWIAVAVAIAFVLTVGTIVQFFFLLTLSRTLKAVSEPNRAISTRTLWFSIVLNQIPGFGSVWELYLVSAMSKSLRREYETRGLAKTKDGFGRIAGFIWAGCGLLLGPATVLQLYLQSQGAISEVVVLSALLMPVEAILFVCFILFWIQMYAHGKTLREDDSRRSAAITSTISP